MERKLVASKKPTDSDPTWYNLYSDGYVEQAGASSSQTVTLPIEMADTNYTFSRTNGNARSATYYAEAYSAITNRTTTGFRMTLESALTPVSWQVNGYAAESEYIDKIVRREFIAY